MKMNTMKFDPMNPKMVPRAPLWESLASLSMLAVLLAGNYLLLRHPVLGLSMNIAALAGISWLFVRDLRRRTPVGRAVWLRLLCASLAVVFLLMTLFLAWRSPVQQRTVLIGAFALMTLLAVAASYAAHRRLRSLRGKVSHDNNRKP